MGVAARARRQLSRLQVALVRWRIGVKESSMVGRS